VWEVNEIFHSIQGEGSRAGQAMAFIRLTGCNLRCSFCDTTRAYEEGKCMALDEIIVKCMEKPIPWVCLTGGEPLLQNVKPLLDCLHEFGYMVAVETNGTLFIPEGFDHVTVSPKRGHEPCLAARMEADEWKYIIQDESDFDRIEYEADVWVQPVDNDPAIARLCVEKIKEHPGWRLSMQLHKIIGVR
jgi:7-carboxy-7-deazaguanine synthase